MSDELIYTQSDSKTIAGVIGKIADAMQGVKTDDVLKGCLGAAVFLNKPDITMPKLVEAVEAASEWLALWLREPAEGEKIN